MKKYNNKNFYGKFTSGASFFNSNKNLFHKKNIKYFNYQLKKNLKKMKLTEKEINNKIVMDVGSGRQALAFLPLNPKKIYHYDISYLNIKRFNKFIRKNKIGDKIISKQLDLTRNKLPKKKFDFIYLHGIIQHTERVNVAIENLCSSLKVNGSMWFYFYRPGSLHVFLGSVQRKLIKDNNINIKKFYSYVKRKKLGFNFIDSIMDDCFVPIRQLFYPSDYRKFLSNNSCHVFGNTFVTKYRNNVNFLKYHQSATFFVKKNINTPSKKDNLLRRGYSVNVLDKNLYYKEKNIQLLLKMIKQANYENKSDIIDLIIFIEKIKNIITKEFLKDHSLNKKKYINLIKRLNNRIAKNDKL